MDSRFDGDTSSFITLNTKEGIDEIIKYKGSRKAYVGTDGKFINSTSTGITDLIAWNLTRFNK